VWRRMAVYALGIDHAIWTALPLARDDGKGINSALTTSETEQGVLFNRVYYSTGRSIRLRASTHSRIAMSRPCG